MTVPTIGRIVIYTLSQEDATAIIQRRMRTVGGTQLFTGNPVGEGKECPMMIVAVHGDEPDSAVNGTVFLDGSDTIWVTSVHVGTGPRTFRWPVPAGATK